MCGGADCFILVARNDVSRSSLVGCTCADFFRPRCPCLYAALLRQCGSAAMQHRPYIFSAPLVICAAVVVLFWVSWMHCVVLSRFTVGILVSGHAPDAPDVASSSRRRIRTAWHARAVLMNQCSFCRCAWSGWHLPARASTIS